MFTTLESHVEFLESIRIGLDSAEIVIPDIGDNESYYLYTCNRSDINSWVNNKADENMLDKIQWFITLVDSFNESGLFQPPLDKLRQYHQYRLEQYQSTGL